MNDERKSVAFRYVDQQVAKHMEGFHKAYGVKPPEPASRNTTEKKTVEGLMEIVGRLTGCEFAHSSMIYAAVESYARALIEQSRLEGAAQERALWELAKEGQAAPAAQQAGEPVATVMKRLKDGKPKFVIQAHAHFDVEANLGTLLYAGRPPATDELQKALDRELAAAVYRLRAEIAAAEQAPQPAARVPMTDSALELKRLIGKEVNYPHTPRSNEWVTKVFGLIDDLAQQPARTVTVEDLPALPEPALEDHEHEWCGQNIRSNFWCEEQVRVAQIEALRKFGIEVRG